MVTRPVVTLGALRIDGIKVDVTSSFNHAALEFRVRLLTRDVADEVAPNQLHNVGVVPEGTWAAMAADQRASFVRSLVLRTVEHEVDEWLRIDGRLVTNAHPETPGYAPDAIFGGDP